MFPKYMFGYVWYPTDQCSMVRWATSVKAGHMFTVCFYGGILLTNEDLWTRMNHNILHWVHSLKNVLSNLRITVLRREFGDCNT